MIDIDRMRIEGFVSSSDASDVRLEQPAEVVITRGDDKSTVKGRVTFISPEVNPQSDEVRVYLEIENADREFRSGVRVEARILPALQTAIGK